MRRQGHVFWVLIVLILVVGIGTGCTPLPAKVTEPASEPSSVASPLALPTDVSPLLSPLPTPTPHVAPAVQSVLPPIQTSPLPPFPGSPQDPVAWAIADLAQRLGVQPSTVEVLEVTRQELPLPDLGCPSPKSGRPEKPVLPAVVIGQAIRLRAAGMEYEYHVHARKIVFCGRQ